MPGQTMHTNVSSLCATGRADPGVHVRGMSMEVGGGSRPIGPLTPAMVSAVSHPHHMVQEPLFKLHFLPFFRGF